jgi:hypothetical protein
VKFVQDDPESVAYRLTMFPTRNHPLPPPLDGEVSFDDQARTDAAEDFGHLLRRAPEGVLHPGSAEDVAATVRWAAGHGRRFAAQGNRHSVYGRAQAGDGIVADLRRLRAVHDVQDDQVAVDAGATLPLVPAPQRVRRFLLFYPGLAAMLADQRLLTGERRFEVVQGAVLANPAGAGRSGSTWSRSSPGARRTTASCWPAWPTTGSGGSRAPWPTSTTWTGWPHSSGRCGPTASGGSRIRG